MCEFEVGLSLARAALCARRGVCVCVRGAVRGVGPKVYVMTKTKKGMKAGEKVYRIGGYVT